VNHNAQRENEQKSTRLFDNERKDNIIFEKNLYTHI